MGVANYPEYTEAEIEFLRKVYPANGLKKTHELFNNKFGLHTEAQIRHRLNKFGIKSNYSGKFQKGGVAWNKGIDLATERPDLYEKYVNGERYKFKKGVLPKNTKPIGYEKEYRDGILVKVAMPNVWKQRARINYEKANKCVLKSSDKILHLDGNCFNDDVENLIKVNDKILAKLNKQGMIFDEAKLTKSAVYREMILERIKELENG